MTNDGSSHVKPCEFSPQKNRDLSFFRFFSSPSYTQHLCWSCSPEVDHHLCGLTDFLKEVISAGALLLLSLLTSSCPHLIHPTTTGSLENFCRCRFCCCTWNEGGNYPETKTIFCTSLWTCSFYLGNLKCKPWTPFWSWSLVASWLQCWAFPHWLHYLAPEVRSPFNLGFQTLVFNIVDSNWNCMKNRR